MSIFVGQFDKEADILAEFAAPADALDGAVVLFAAYHYEDYSGSAIVVYMQNGKLYEVNGSHCSCNGLEYSWEPQETSLKALQMRNYSHEKYWGEYQKFISGGSFLVDCLIALQTQENHDQ